MEEKENEKLYKFVGYSVFVLTLVGIIAMFGYLVYYHQQKIGVIYCKFPYIGELKLDDSFEVNGKLVGMVKRITTNEPNKVILTINLKRPVVIHEGYKLFLNDIGIMGERVVSLENGPPDAPVVNLADTLKGEYFPGISDMLGRMPELRDFLDDCILFVRNIQEGTDSVRSIIEWLNSAEEAIDKIALSIVNTMQSWDSDLPEILHNINDFSENFNADLTKFGEKLPDILEKTAAIIDDCDTLLTKIAQILELGEKIETLVGKIDGFDVNSLNSTLAQWQNKILNISREAHKLQLWIRFGWKDAR